MAIGLMGKVTVYLLGKPHSLLRDKREGLAFTKAEADSSL